MCEREGALNFALKTGFERWSQKEADQELAQAGENQTRKRNTITNGMNGEMWSRCGDLSGLSEVEVAERVRDLWRHIKAGA